MNANELLKNIDIMEGTFEKIGLDIMSINVREQGETDNDISLFMELTGENLESDFKITYVFYDPEGLVFESTESYIRKNDFVGYLVIKENFNYSREFLSKVSSGRIFAAKY